MNYPGEIAADDFGNAFVNGQFTNNVFNVSENDITEIISGLTQTTSRLATDSEGNLYVSSSGTSNEVAVFKILALDGSNETLVRGNDGGINTCNTVNDIVVGPTDTVFVGCQGFQYRVYRLDPPTPEPTGAPTSTPTSNPTAAPTSNPTVSPTSGPTEEPTMVPGTQCRGGRGLLFGGRQEKC